LGGKGGFMDQVIRCDVCGKIIWRNGFWLDDIAGQCSGPCERELCGVCGDWDVNGECEFCRNSPCGSCQNHKAIDICRQCEHLADRKKWADFEEENPYKGREDERNCHCNNCEEKFREGEIKIKGDEEFYPVCGKFGFIADETEENDPCDACPYHTEVACMGCIEKVK
jgi:hypothetical protein